MATRLLYMEYFGTKTSLAIVQEVRQIEDGRYGISLDQTSFYPRGGGQDWDTGRLAGDNGELVVDEVRLDEEGTVWHIGQLNGQIGPGEQVTCYVNTERRMTNTRLHSGGHVVDMAVSQLGLDWIPGKGSHYPHMSSVEYRGTWELEKADEVKAGLQASVDEAINRGGANEIRFMDVSDMHTVCRHVPENIPKNKPARVVIYPGNFGVPCGGTHVADLSEIGNVTITKIKQKDGIIKVSYAVEGIN